ncbi:MAG: class I SAM-dependent methyltransferase [Flavobacterium sp.]|nr:class I SAM-dependent methyltransferase [Flavobacterium sp.]
MKSDFDKLLRLDRESFALQQIQKIFPSPFFIPVTSWSISPSAVLMIMNDIMINDRKHIIEFGSGMSTIYIAQLLKIYKPESIIYSVESDMGWISQMERDLQRYDLADQVVFVHAPLTAPAAEIRFKDQTLWYDAASIDAILGDATFDLVLVDGPFGGSSPFARYSAVPYIKSRLAPTYSVYLDDVHRATEQEIVVEWKNILNCKVHQSPNARHSRLHNTDGFNITPIFL